MAVGTEPLRYVPSPAGPSVTLVEPFADARLGIEFDAEAAVDGFDSVSKVEFLIDGSMAAEVLEAPYAEILAQPAAGTHTVSARATGLVDGQSTTITSPGVSVTAVQNADFLRARAPGESAPEQPGPDPVIPAALLERPDESVAEGDGGPQMLSMTPFNSKMVDYAKKYWNKYNPNFKDYSSQGGHGDCANFVSQILRNGGWKFVNPYRDEASVENWWYKQKPGTSNDSNSQTWSVSESLRHAFDYGALDRGSKLRSGQWRSSIRNAHVGDVIFVDLYENGELDSNHTLFVTAVRDRNVYVTYHTTDRKNRPMFPVSAGDFQYQKYKNNAFLESTHPAYVWVFATKNPKGAP
jgi:hypothetical protein